MHENLAITTDKCHYVSLYYTLYIAAKKIVYKLCGTDQVDGRSWFIPFGDWCIIDVERIYNQWPEVCNGIIERNLTVARGY